MRLTNQFGSFYQLRKWYRKTFSGCSSGREFSGIRGDREPERLSLSLSLFLYAGHSPTALRHAMLLSTKSVLTTRIYLLASFYLVLVRTVVCSMESRERKKKKKYLSPYLRDGGSWADSVQLQRESEDFASSDFRESRTTYFHLFALVKSATR